MRHVRRPDVALTSALQLTLGFTRLRKPTDNALIESIRSGGPKSRSWPQTAGHCSLPDDASKRVKMQKAPAVARALFGAVEAC
jgi:hypothetical protein